jgi:hypothetical protein
MGLVLPASLFWPFKANPAIKQETAAKEGGGHFIIGGGGHFGDLGWGSGLQLAVGLWAWVWWLAAGGRKFWPKVGRGA